jgi:hypothetical protein
MEITELSATVANPKAYFFFSNRGYRGSCELFIHKAICGILRGQKIAGVQSPIEVRIVKGIAIIEKKAWFSKKVYPSKEVYFNYFLIFQNDLTAVEIEMWKMFKAGWFVGRIKRYDQIPA